ncbi:MAG: hypothetical protein KJ593_07550 [Candidatus Omnitrophica bacterium]|nr:hypothetical protein [Candidatus Omnitrophota bacterium]
MYKKSNYGIGFSPLEKATYSVGLRAYAPELQSQELLFARVKNPQAYESILAKHYNKFLDYIKGMTRYNPTSNTEETSTLEKNITNYHSDIKDKKQIDPRTHYAFPLGPEAAIIVDIGLNPTGLKTNSLGNIEQIRLK